MRINHKMEGLKREFLFFICVIVSSVSSTIISSDVHQHQAAVRHHRRCHGVEYHGLGCFHLDPPFTNTHWLPQRPAFVDTVFLLYTRNNRHEGDRIHGDIHEIRSRLASSHFNPNHPVKFIIHGFLQYGTMEFQRNMTRALLSKSPMNVIVVGWGGGAGFPYTQAVANTRLVGAQTTRLVRALLSRGVAKSQIHLIGHSLGAHIAGYVGSSVPGLARITGLDPAQPNFEGFDIAVRLDKTDADFVDIIHTDAQAYDTVRGYGMVEPVGHVDFYPNGGKNQPGCHDETSILGFMEDAWSNGMTEAEFGISCSHERSSALFTASILQSSRTGPQCSFQGIPCASDESFMRGECLDCGNRPCPVMGFDASVSYGATGVFYLNTTDSPDFCGFHYFVTISIHPDMSYSDGVLKAKLTGRNGTTPWGVVKSGRLNGGDVLTTLILGQTDIDAVTRVDVRFDHSAGYFSWGQNTVQLSLVKVNSLMQFPTKYFCGSTMTVQDGHELSLTSGSFRIGDCL